jgi:hypothetical protein
VDDERLIDTSDSELEKRMLRAAADEKVPADVRRRALASLGLLAVAPPIAVSTEITSTKGATAAAAEWAGWQVSLLKAGAVMGISGIVIGVGAIVVRTPASHEPHLVNTASVAGSEGPKPVSIQPTDPPRRGVMSDPTAASPWASARPAAARASSTSALAPSLGGPRPAPAVATSPGRLSSVGASHDRTAGTRGAPAPGSDAPLHLPAASIREEIDLLDRARAELTGGNSVAATEIIGQYFARYPNGELRAEAEFVRREARLAAE